MAAGGWTFEVASADYYEYGRNPFIDQVRQLVDRLHAIHLPDKNGYAVMGVYMHPFSEVVFRVGAVHYEIDSSGSVFQYASQLTQKVDGDICNLYTRIFA